MRRPPETRGFFVFGGILFVLGAIIACGAFLHYRFEGDTPRIGPAAMDILMLGAAMSICGAVFLGVGKLGAEIHRQGMN